MMLERHESEDLSMIYPRVIQMDRILCTRSDTGRGLCRVY